MKNEKTIIRKTPRPPLGGGKTSRPPLGGGIIGLMGLMGLIGLIGLVGCSSGEEVVEQDSAVMQEGTVPIGFRASVNGENAAVRATRAGDPDPGPQPGDGELTTELLQKVGIGVYCWYTVKTDVVFTNNPALLPDRNPNVPVNHIKTYMGETGFVLMNNQRVVYSEGTSTWGYTPEKYWPLEPLKEKLTFRAYAPYTTYMVMNDGTGMPLLPVVVTKDDYHNGTQHDPLWGTSMHDGVDAVGTTYGTHYNNYTYVMSGDELTADDRDGIIDWYFHHGMAKLMFACSVIADPGCDKVTITSIEIKPLYERGLLDLNSLTGSADEKPTWQVNDQSGNMTVKLNEGSPNTEAGDLAPIPKPDPEPVGFNPYPFVIKTGSSETAAVNLLSKGLLIIPRDFTSSPMNVAVTYTIDDETEPQTAIGTINANFYGNTAYTINLSLTPATQGLEITMVQSAFMPWDTGGSIERVVYNW